MDDALDISSWTILINAKPAAAVSWVTLDWKTPEDILNVIWGSVRRRKQATFEWSADYVMLYDNLSTMTALTNWTKFNIELAFSSTPEAWQVAKYQKFTIYDCTINSHNMSFWESSTFKCSWTAAYYGLSNTAPV